MQVQRVLIIFILAAVLGGCSWLKHEEDEDVLAVAQQLLDAQKDENGEPLNIKLPIQINYTIDRKALIDHDVEIEFEFVAEKEIPVLRIGMTTSDGLVLDSSDVKERYLDLQPRQTFTKSVVVIPKEENVFYLNVFVVTQIGDEKLAKLIKIPIALGEYSKRKKKGLAQ